MIPMLSGWCYYCNVISQTFFDVDLRNTSVQREYVSIVLMHLLGFIQKLENAKLLNINKL